MPGPSSVLKNGESTLNLDYEKRESVHLHPEGPNDNVSEAESTSLGVHFGFAHGWQLGLGGKGVSSRGGAGSDAALSGGYASVEKNSPLSENISFGLGVFADGGSTDADEGHIIARSGHGKVGVFSRIEFLKKGLMSSLTLGHRSRGEEKYGDLTLKNELFYVAKVSFLPKRFLGMFAEAKGRSFRIKDESGLKVSEKDYSLYDFKAGASTSFDRWELQAFGGRGFGSSEGTAFGQGRKIVGASLTVTLGYAHGVSQKKASTKPNSAKAVQKFGNHGDEILYDLKETSKVGHKPEKEIGTVMDDFDLVDKRLKESGLAESLQTEDQIAEEEIRRLREVEEKQKRLKSKEISISEKERRLRVMEELESERAEEADLTEDMEDEIEALPVISNDDLLWRGLE